MATYNSMAPVVQPRPTHRFRNSLFWFILVGGVAYWLWWLWKSPDVPVVQPAQQVIQVIVTATPEMQRIYTDNSKVELKPCTAVGGDCMSIVPGPPADYSTGSHVDADGRTRPNPPAGLWTGRVVYQQCAGNIKKLRALQYNPDGVKEIQSCD